MLDEDKKTALDLAKDGHNLVVIGQGGCGKTFIIKEMVNYLRSKGKTVTIACSTGIASTHYGKLGGTTLHKWSGIGDGRYLNEEIVHLIKTDERFNDVKDNVQSTNTLIIDEISMISSKVLGQVQFICQKVRSSSVLFGNLQVILAGDFLQLPPVANELVGDRGLHCFNVPWFNRCFPHKIKLNFIHRQSDTTLIKCINALERGNVSDEDVAFINSLSRPLENEENCVHLFSRNIDVDIHNYTKIQTVAGELKIYKSVDEGSNYYLDKFLAPKNLGLKVGCPVMLLKNLSNVLVNGLRGIVFQMNPESVDVKFETEMKTITVNIQRCTFTTFDPVDKTVLAKRNQLPLKAAYAITVHKAQGMSLNNVVVHCEHCTQPGQIGVAVGRAVSLDGLRILNFTKSLCREHLSSVSLFHENVSVGTVQEDLSCCRNQRAERDHVNDDNNDDDDNDDDTILKINDNLYDFDSDFSDYEIEIVQYLDSIEETDNVETASSLSSKQILDLAIQDFIDTPVEEKILQFKNLLLSKIKVFNEWFQSQSAAIQNIGDKSFPKEAKYSNKNKNAFFVEFNTYLNSKEYETSVISLLKKCGLNEKGPEFQVLTAILFCLEKQFFENLSDCVELQLPEPVLKVSVDSDLAPSARGKIRYVSGYVIGKLKYNLSRKIRRVLFALGMEFQFSKLQNQMKLVNSLCTSYADLTQQSKDPLSLEETKRKQNEREGLTNITDKAFEFFEKLEQLCRQLLTHVNLAVHGKNLFSFVKSELKKNCELFQIWLNSVSNASISISDYQELGSRNDDSEITEILTTLVNTSEDIIDLYNFVLDLFLKVNLSQFRKDYLALIKKEKAKALRKKVSEKSKKQCKTLNINFCKEDKSSNKNVSHFRLKSEISQKASYLSEKFTKNDLFLLYKAYDLKVSKQKRKDDITKVLSDKILQCDTMPCPGELKDGSTVEETSNVNTDDLNLPSTSTMPSTDIVDLPSTSGFALSQTEGSASVGTEGSSLTTDLASVSSSTLTSETSDTTVTMSAKSRKSVKRKTSTRSVGKGKGKGKGKSKRSKIESNDTCQVCNEPEREGEQWICCDRCLSWYHRACACIQDDDWKQYTEHDIEYLCPLCQ